MLTSGKGGHLLDMLFAQLDGLAQRARPYVPFTELNTVYRCMVEDAKSILDLGCGKGGPMRFINRRKEFNVVGVDTFEPSLKECKYSGVYGDLVICDVNYLPFKKKSFDLVLCLALIEHLEKEEGEKLLHDMEEIARRQVIISTPVGEYKQGVLNGNPYQQHRYCWEPAELKEKGYKARGVGIRGVMGEDALFSRLARVIGAFRWVPWLLAGPLVYFLPKLAGTQVCWKQIRTSI